jgi:hypothetical protein
MRDNVVRSKAAEGCRSPRRYRDFLSICHVKNKNSFRWRAISPAGFGVRQPSGAFSMRDNAVRSKAAGGCRSPRRYRDFLSICHVKNKNCVSRLRESWSSARGGVAEPAGI